MNTVLSLQRLLAGMLLLLSTTAAALSAPIDGVELRDLEIALHVRRALMQDADLAELNLAVSVRLNEATLWGDVPTIELAHRALRLAEEVKGVYKVKNDLNVHGNPREDTLRHLVEGLSGAGRGVDVAAPAEISTPPGEAKLQQVFNARPDLRAWEKSEPAYRPASGSGVSLLPPVFTVAPAALTAPPVVLLTPRAGTSNAKDLHAEVEEVRAADAHFREVRAEISAGRVTLSGRVDDMETLIELGRAISRLSGVLYVDLRGVVIGR